MTTTCDLLDARPELGCCLLPLHQYGGRDAFSGPIRTVTCIDDNVLVRSVLDEPGDGRVLVIDGHGSRAVALLGDAMARRAAAGGWSGLIVNGAVRDVTALATVELGIAAVGHVPRRAGKTGVGAVDVPVTFGGVTFLPGDDVWCDADGVVVGPAAG